MEVVDDVFVGLIGVTGSFMSESAFGMTGVTGGFGVGFASPTIPPAASIESFPESNCPRELLFSG